MKIAALRLPKEKENRLRVLAENEKIYIILARKYDTEKIQQDLDEIDSQLKSLAEKREEIIEKRLKVSVQELAKFERHKKHNDKERIQILTQHGLLAKIVKAKKLIKETERLLLGE